MQKSQFKEFCDIAYERAGIYLKQGKEALVQARVAKRLRALKLNSVNEYLDLLRNDTEGEELVQFLDVISTNFTSFMREKDHFEDFGNALTTWYKAKQRRFRIWCAAASSGEEPYTIAITIHENISVKNSDIRVLATDISTRMLNRAVLGKYTKSKIAPLPIEQRKKYFRKLDEIEKGEPVYQVKDYIKDVLVFKRFNLATPPFPMKGPLDVVFCRNVMIYFNNETRQALISEIERLLKPGGILFTGHSETLAGIKTSLVIRRPSVYEKPL